MWHCGEGKFKKKPNAQENTNWWMEDAIISKIIIVYNQSKVENLWVQPLMYVVSAVCVASFIC